MSSSDDIKTTIQCQNLAPLKNLSKTITSNSLKIGVFANNGSGKTFISRLFRLTEDKSALLIDEEGKIFTDKLISFGENKASFSFSIIDKTGTTKENFKFEINKGFVPTIPKTEYLYHTFNQDYVDENIKTLSYEKDSNIQGFILGKANIDVSEDEKKLAKIEKEGKDLSEKVKQDIADYLEDNINDIYNIKRLNEYKELSYENLVENIDKPLYNIGKTFTDLLNDYNKIKSVPENLADISPIPEIQLNSDIFSVIIDSLLKVYSLSSLAEEFKAKIKSKQTFVETGMQLISNQSFCPFCEQDLQTEALALIDNYTKYLNDEEAKTIKNLNNYKILVEDFYKKNEQNLDISIKRTNEFNKYKTQYIPSLENVELQELVIIEIQELFKALINQINEKLKSIEIPLLMPFDFSVNLLKYQTIINGVIEQNNKEINNLNFKKNRISDENKSIRKLICNAVYDELFSFHAVNIKTILKLRNDWTTLSKEIKKKKEQQKISKKAKVASTIKQVLNYFFSAKYTLDEDTFRLIFNQNILDKGQTKDVLSEGEKNIIAFAYYIGDTHLKISNENEYEKIFFVIDDPISSMDFTHVYTLCGVIRDIKTILNKIKRERLLIFTHNNDFMRVLASNNIVDKKLILKGNEIKEFNNNLTVPYIHHLFDIYSIARKSVLPTHTTANSIRHILETLTKFENVEIASESIAEYIKINIPSDTKSYTLINDLSHGGWRSEQAPITDDEYIEICETVVKHLESKYNGQVTYCEKWAK